MKSPPLSSQQFLFLGGLLDGREKNYAEIREDIEHTGCDEQLSSCSSRLDGLGLLQKSQALRRREKPLPGQSKTYRETVFRITAAGRRAWNETLDWHLYIATKFSDSNTLNSSQSRDPIISKRPLQPNHHHRQAVLRDRPPTDPEATLILATASPQFAILFRVMRRTEIPYTQLITHDVHDIDLTAQTVSLGDDLRPVPLDAELRTLLTAALAGRASGPLFLSPRRNRWAMSNVSRTFTRLRRKLNIPKNVVIGRRGGRRRGRESIRSRHQRQTKLTQLQRSIPAGSINRHRR